MQLVGRHFDTKQAVQVDVRDGVIADIRPWGGGEDRALPWIAPGLVDLQVNGYGGREFTDAALNVETVEQVSLAMDRGGVTRYLATVVTQEHSVQRHVLATIARAVETSEVVRRRVAGIHLEGPYVSSEDGPRGAHAREHCRPPDWGEFQSLQEAARGNIRLLTMSPEYPGAGEFIGRVCESGVMVSIGHTNATGEQIDAAVAAGARMSTHLGNGAHGILHRHFNYIWSQLAHDELTATLIVDGHHLPPPVVKAFVRVKSAARVILISDITGMAGTSSAESGRHRRTSLGDVEMLDDGRVVVAGQREYLAGATEPLAVGVANVVRFAGVDLAAAIEMASANPAKLLHLPGGQLAIGAAADLIQFDLGNQPDSTLHVRATINGGTCVFRTPCHDGSSPA